MSGPLCATIDDYLGATLAPPERAAFVEHLTGCADCRAVVAEFADLGRHLRDGAVLEPIPATLAARVRRRMRRRPLFAGVTGLAAAAALLLVVGAHLGPGPPVVAARRPVAPPEPPSVVRVEFSPETPVLAVRQPTRSRNVTILWVYPTAATAAESVDSDP